MWSTKQDIDQVERSWTELTPPTDNDHMAEGIITTLRGDGWGGETENSKKAKKGNRRKASSQIEFKNLPTDLKNSNNSYKSTGKKKNWYKNW